MCNFQAPTVNESSIGVNRDPAVQKNVGSQGRRVRNSLCDVLEARASTLFELVGSDDLRASGPAR